MKTENKKSWLYNFMMELIIETNPGFDLKCQIKKLESDLKEQSDKTDFYYADNKRLYGENSDLRKSIGEKNLTIKAQGFVIDKHSTKINQQKGIISQLHTELEDAKVNADKWIAQRERIKGKAKIRRAKAKEAKTTGVITIDEITMPIELHAFLVEEGILNRFIECAKNYMSPNKITAIVNAFDWDDTSEGCMYWNELDTKFHEQQQRKEANNGTK